MNTWYDKLISASKNNKNNAEGWIAYLAKSFASETPPTMREVEMVVQSGLLADWQEIILRDSVLEGTNTYQYVQNLYKRRKKKTAFKDLFNFLSELAIKKGNSQLLKRNLNQVDVTNQEVFESLTEQSLLITGGAGSGKTYFLLKYLGFLKEKYIDAEFLLVDLKRVEFLTFQEDKNTIIFEGLEDVEDLIKYLLNVSFKTKKKVYVFFSDFTMMLNCLEETVSQKLIAIINEQLDDNNLFFVIESHDALALQQKGLEDRKITQVVFKNHPSRMQDNILEHAERGTFKIENRHTRYYKLENQK